VLLPSTREGKKKIEKRDDAVLVPFHLQFGQKGEEGKGREREGSGKKRDFS